jgi:hypothetical protein
MECQRCKSENLGIFTSEIAIHAPRTGGIDKDTLWVFPELTICLACGAVGFDVPPEELGTLEKAKLT